MKNQRKKKSPKHSIPRAVAWMIIWGSFDSFATYPPQSRPNPTWRQPPCHGGSCRLRSIGSRRSLFPCWWLSTEVKIECRVSERVSRRWMDESNRTTRERISDGSARQRRSEKSVGRKSLPSFWCWKNEGHHQWRRWRKKNSFMRVIRWCHTWAMRGKTKSHFQRYHHSHVSIFGVPRTANSLPKTSIKIVERIFFNRPPWWIGL